MAHWLLVDCNNQCWKAFHVFGSFRHEDDLTGVAFGLFRDLKHLVRRFDADGVAFCFDQGRGLREVEHPAYKCTRRSMATTREQAQCRSMIARLRDEALPRIGFRNVLSADGYEADDVIASLVWNTLGEGDAATIVSSDQDLWQLLLPQVSAWTGKRLVTYGGFVGEWGIKPHRWADAKAMAGCATDDVIGIKGVGVKTACQYLAGTLRESSVYRKRIEAGRSVWEANLDLVALPYPGCPKFSLREDEFDHGAWDAACREWRMDSLLGEYPVPARFQKHA